MATIVKTGGGVPVSDYEALQSSYNSLNSTYSSYKNSHAHSNDEYNNLQSQYNGKDLNGGTPHLINQKIWIDSSTYNYSFTAPAYGVYILAFCVFGAYTSDKQGMSFTPTMSCTKNGTAFEGGGIATRTIKNNGRSAYLITFQTAANAGDKIACSCTPGIDYWNGQLFHAVGYYK